MTFGQGQHGKYVRTQGVLLQGVGHQHLNESTKRGSILGLSFSLSAEKVTRWPSAPYKFTGQNSNALDSLLSFWDLLAVRPHSDILDRRLRWLTVIAHVRQLGEFTVQKQPQPVRTWCNKTPSTSAGLGTRCLLTRFFAALLRMPCVSMHVYHSQQPQETTTRL